MTGLVHLVVPVDVEALLVPADSGAQGLAPMADFAVLPWSDGTPHNPGPYVSAAALANSTPFGGAAPMVPGVHLHWALPDGLTHGVAGTGAARVEFPRVPDRWLVTRVAVDGTDPVHPVTTVTSWVVESDRLSTAATAPPGLAQPTVPVKASPGQNFRFVGASFPLEHWAESAAERLTPLTAVGYGEPTFAAFYPNSSTVFGFLDTAPPAGAHTSLSYSVAGWYSDPADDPLTSVVLDPADNRYRWSYTGSTPPNATMCAGTVTGVGAPSAAPAAEALAAPAGGLTVAVARSTAEAASAMLAHVLSAQDPTGFANAEQVLNALQFGLLTGSGDVTSIARFEQAVHAAGFGAVDAGVLWSVAPADREPGVGEPHAEGAEVTLPRGLGADLNELNTLQLRVDELTERLAALRRALFDDWYRDLVVDHDAAHVPPDLRDRLTDVDALLRDRVAAVNAIVSPGGSLDLLTRQRDAKAASIRASLAPSLVLTSEGGAPRYYRPSDPVLVLAGDDVAQVARYGQDGAGTPDGYLPCRVETQVLSSATLAAGLVTGSAEAVLPATSLPGLAARFGPQAALVEALLREAFLLAPALLPAAAAAVAAQGGTANPAVLDFPGTVEALRAAAAALLAGTPPAGVTYAGLAPAPLLLHAWTGNPWLPILLQYEVSLRSVAYVDLATGRTGYGEDFVDSSFALVPDDVDLVYTGASLQDRVQLYSGTAVLTPDATVDLAAEIERFLDASGGDDPELTDVLAALKRLPLLSQGLSGTVDAMLMHHRSIQLPVADPLGSSIRQRLVSAVSAAVAGAGSAAPMPQVAFNPVHSGGLTVTRLRLVDVFGRFRDYPNPEAVVARSVTPPPALGLPAGTAFLPPRITQPARLLFRWLAADGSAETNVHPATSPILGWVVPTYLDRSIAIYDAAGTALGSLGLSGDSSRVLWTAAPGGAHPPGTPIETVLADADPELYGAALALFAGGDGAYFAAFFEAVRSALTFALPDVFKESARSSVLSGQPLALARAGLALDLQGPAATDVSWTSFTTSVLDDQEPSTAGFDAIEFPVALGALAQLEDTLVGYWRATGGATDYGTFYAVAEDAEGRGVTPPAQDTLVLTARDDVTDRQVVTLLLDPRGSVHATTGILPTKAIAIPPNQYADVLAELRLVFRTAPVLSGSGTPGSLSLVLPDVPAGTWSWAEVAAGAWRAAEVADAPAEATYDYGPQRVAEGWLRLDPGSGGAP